MSNWKDRATKVNTSAGPSWKDRAKVVESARSPASEDSEDGLSLKDIGETAEDTLRGAAQGATFGFADELQGGLGAAKDVLTGDATLDKVMDAYRKNRDSAREQYKQSEDRSPTASFVGNLAGGIAPALLSGGTAAAPEAATLLTRLLNAGRVGGSAGAIMGLGNSEADITKGELGKAIDDTGEGLVGGALTGGLVQGGIEGVKGAVGAVKAAGNMLSKTDLAKKFELARKYGKEGVKIFDREGLSQAQEGVEKAATDLGMQAKKVNADAGTELGNIKKGLRESGKTLNIDEEIKTVQNAIKLLEKSDNPDAGKDVQKLQAYLDNLLKGKEVEVPVQHTQYTPGSKIEAKPSAREALELEATKAKKSAELLGQDLNTNIVDSTDDQGRKLLTLLKNSDENVGAAERAIPVKDKEGNVIDTLLNQGDSADNFKSNASAKTVLDTPGQEAGYTPAERGPVVTENVKTRQGGVDPTQVGFEKAEDVLGTLNNLNGVAGGAPSLATNEAINATKKAAGNIKGKMTELPELATANQKSHASFQALDSLGLGPDDFEKDAITKKMRLTPQAEGKLKNLVRRIGTGDETQAGANASDLFDDSIRLLEAADPEKANALRASVSRAGEIHDLARTSNKLKFLNPSTLQGAAPATAGNIVGLTQRTIGKAVSEATPQQLKMVVQDLMSKGGKQLKLVQPLVEAMQKDQTGRNASLFAIQQNPEYRSMLKDYFNEDHKE